MSRPRSVAVLGAGILGACTALGLARRGLRVSLFDAAAAPFSGASRWNEGKIHLGHLYANDPGLGTARRLLPGGLAFRGLVESLLGLSLRDACTDHDDTFAVHRESVVSVDSMSAYLEAATALVREHPAARGYLADVSRARVARLDAATLARHYDAARVQAAFRVPERSVDTQWLADRFVEALAAEPRIEARMATRIGSVHRVHVDALLEVRGEHGELGRYDAVVNALWEGRPALDVSFGLPPPPPRSHRYRVSAFVHSTTPLDLQSSVLVTGPFGDVKRYSPRHFYVSWYPAGLLAHGDGIAPPPTPVPLPAERASIAEAIFRGLGAQVPQVAALAAPGNDVRIEGGWVYALGTGLLSDARSALHRRDRVGIERSGRYYSVDTGKYSIAPWLAAQLVDEIAAG